MSPSSERLTEALCGYPNGPKRISELVATEKCLHLAMAKLREAKYEIDCYMYVAYVISFVYASIKGSQCPQISRSKSPRPIDGAILVDIWRPYREKIVYMDIHISHYENSLQLQWRLTATSAVTS